ncbi:MAG: hypothetical protein ACI91T_002756, partial [Natronomonas sp.]
MDQEESVPLVTDEVGRLVFGLAVAASGHDVWYGIRTHNASPGVIGRTIETGTPTRGSASPSP